MNRVTPSPCLIFAILFALGSFAFAGEGEPPNSVNPEIVCYAALDEGFSRPLLEEFQKRTGYRVNMVFDSESTKSVGLANRLIAEAGRPRCDVYWNNEILNTLRLKERGVLAEYRPEAANGFPEEFKDPDGRWVGFAARARVIIVNTDLFPREHWPVSLNDFVGLAERLPEIKGKVGMGKPLFGTTASWMASLYQKELRDDSEGDSPAHKFLDALENDLQVRILAGNKQSALAVGRGDLFMAFTDTDDALIEMESGKPVAMIYPLDGGYMLIPNTLSLVNNCPNPEGGKALIEFLLSPENEIRLANSASAQIPVNPAIRPGVDYQPRIDLPAQSLAFQPDWQEVVKHWEEAMLWITDFFEL